MHLDEDAGQRDMVSANRYIRVVGEREYARRRSWSGDKCQAPDEAVTDIHLLFDAFVPPPHRVLPSSRKPGGIRQTRIDGSANISMLTTLKPASEVRATQ